MIAQLIKNESIFAFFYLLKQSSLAIQVCALKVQDQVKFDTNSGKGHGSAMMPPDKINLYKKSRSSFRDLLREWSISRCIRALDRVH